MSTDTGPTKVIFPTLRQTGTHEESGFQHGHAAGYAAGIRAAAKEQRRLRDKMMAEHADAMAAWREATGCAVAALEAAAAAVNRRTVEVLADAEDALAASALELAEAILGYELADGERTARAALARALSGADAEAVTVVRLHPADLSALETDAYPGPDVRLVPDPMLDRGDAVAENAHGWLDARISTALDRARAALLGDTL
jgi:flagellar assembly protein FliH